MVKITLMKYQLLTNWANGTKTIYTITIPYRLHENITIHYIDEDSKKEIGNPSVISNQETISVTTINPATNVIENLTNHHYVLDTTATDGKNNNFVLNDVVMSDGTTLNLDQSNNFSQTIALPKEQNHVNSYAAKNLVFDNTENPNGESLDHNKKKDYNYNYIPKGEDYNHNIGPKGQNIPTKQSNLVSSKADHNSASTNTLPETSEKKSNLGVIGLSLAAVAGLMGLAIKKRKN